MKKYPVGIQDFKELRTGNYLYIDKTEDVYTLVNSGKYFFLSRPRRFGKSLLLSTLKYFFLGEKQLFEGLWVGEQTDYDWEKHPVVHISFSSIDYKGLGLLTALDNEVLASAAKYDIELQSESLASRFKELIQKLGEHHPKLVLLIDEYDKPLIDYIDQPEQAEINRGVLKNFFSVIKDSDPYLAFFLITGVSKFSKVSVFSDLNHLKDITIHPRHATLCGYTQEEMDQYFGDEYADLAAKNHQTLPETLAMIRHWYNGYQWDIGKAVYNPFSILNLFDSGRFGNYWWETGTPSFLMKLVRKDLKYDLEEMRGGSATFESYTLDNLDWLPLLFQTGYLTIQKYDFKYRLYTLGYPNQEVRESFLQHLLATYRETGPAQSYSLFYQLKEALDDGNMDAFMQVIDTLFATLPYQIFEAKKEAIFHAILHLSFSGLGLLVQSEVSTSKGRVNTIVHIEDRVYIIEVNLYKTAGQTLTQIRDNRYGNPYLHQGKEVIALGISFSSETKSVAEWQEVNYIELLSEG